MKELFPLDNNDKVRQDIMPMRFGCGKVGNVLKPFIFFNRPKELDIGIFIENNPILGKISDNFNMIQKRDKSK